MRTLKATINRTQLKHLIASIGMSHEHFANAYGVSPATISRYLNGKQEIPLTLERFALMAVRTKRVEARLDPTERLLSKILGVEE